VRATNGLATMSSTNARQVTTATPGIPRVPADAAASKAGAIEVLQRSEACGALRRSPMGKGSRMKGHSRLVRRRSATRHEWLMPKGREAGAYFRSTTRAAGSSIGAARGWD